MAQNGLLAAELQVYLLGVVAQPYTGTLGDTPGGGLLYPGEKRDRVDFPPPFLPTIPILSPRCISRETSSKTTSS